MHVVWCATGPRGRAWVACVAGQVCDGAEPGGRALPVSAALQVWACDGL